MKEIEEEDCFQEIQKSRYDRNATAIGLRCCRREENGLLVIEKSIKWTLISHHPQESIPDVLKTKM